MTQHATNSIASSADAARAGGCFDAKNESGVVTTKRCSRCGEVKDVAEFNKHKKGKYGVSGYCKKCKSINDAKYRAENPEKSRAKQMKYRAKNRERRNSYSAKYYSENPEKFKANHARYRSKHPEKIKDRNANNTAELSNSYVSRTLRMPTNQVSQQLIEMKREQLKHYRLMKELKTLLTETGKETK